MEKLPQNPELSFKMYELISGYWVACCIHAVSKLDIADKLLNGPKTLQELARETDADENALYRLLRAVSSVGIFEEKADGTFTLNDFGATLLTDVPGSVKPWALANLGEHFPAFGDLTYGVKTGKVPFEHAHGIPVWEYYQQNPDAGANLAKAMAGMSGAVLKAIIDAYDFKSYKTLVDIGGGNGALMYAILEASPESTGIIFDEPYIADHTIQLIPADMTHRCTTVGGNFFEAVPAGADLYMTKWVIHDWNDEESIKILKNIHKAMPTGSKLLIIDSVIPDDAQNKPHAGKLLDINIMAMTTGKERTLSEFKNLLEKAGLTFKRLIQTDTEISSIVESEKR
jgi:hypothetical protein